MTWPSLSTMTTMDPQESWDNYDRAREARLEYAGFLADLLVLGSPITPDYLQEYTALREAQYQAHRVWAADLDARKAARHD